MMREVNRECIGFVGDIDTIDDNKKIYGKTFNAWYERAAKTYVKYMIEAYDDHVDKSEYPKDIFMDNFSYLLEENEEEHGDADTFWGKIDDLIYDQVF